MKFEGIYTPVITPHRDDGSIDRDAFVKIVEHLIASGVHGVISGGSTGEYYAQSMDERVEMAKFAKEVIGDRVSLTIGTVAIRLQDSILMAETAAKIGASAILVGSPPYSVPTERENALNALTIDRAADLPIMLYNYPGRMGINMGEDFLDRVARSRNFCAIKESSGDINRVHLLARDYPHIQMSCGMDDQALEFFAWGARSWVCGGSNFLPTEHGALYRACAVEGNFARGRRIMSALMPLMRVLEQGGKFIQCIKYGSEMAGFHAGPPRPPLRGLNKDDMRQLEQVVRVLKRTIAEIEAEA
ncbi:MAG: dihydrodipicolinate synthase family protein [Mesorhizobium sp.]|uniref:dihydrodipicolinate synthase family protein n=1 Tax=Mesorhizobium sp. TaxID=1871066 RepID=UPI000FE2C35B|nr:dihydrodipicolinate synthase family protein [Mesorhizobium sp.]RWB00281.1 MAG: dihydrodipicolinate synthase family protein [Mesorhizobium sp.]RWC02145.1 MAG: dihydrodipicolinate synthase family protein [Mesorhizobium sp.]RWO06179.1 MAG: dihydrodipicolinate synthase family protein [Mesorhizobium sp.]RWO28476.1 MAG: dihydrodipicolinate synthase family protein [Mesorhizobium sp.]RWP28614.1 MAG: dihydrodipicolinate synthase family protein [Mesorhizobium sp.]